MSLRVKGISRIIYNYEYTADSESPEDFFLWAEHIMGHFEGFFEGAKTFLTPKLS
jgi:hypothetical protein